MANYHYDEAGNMAAYFLITFLALVLIPLTFSSLSPSSEWVLYFRHPGVLIVFVKKNMSSMVVNVGHAWHNGSGLGSEKVVRC